ncbi:MAG: ABC transporter ATP-binding protein [Promethearchaeota archaeon]|nr:MAG: ABC transporter ATP-binding protein [Candidatus Lokiarchaeota archaeon]
MNGIIPWRLKGFMKGDVEIFSKSIWDYNFMELSKIVGLIKQNPLEQLVTFKVRDEIGFGLENLKYSANEIKKKIDEIAKFMGISHLLDRDIDQLSGGQKQLTILCSFLVMNPKILILDEPIAFLDQKSESLLLERLQRLVKKLDDKLTIVIIEHRLSRIINIANKIVVLDDKGKIKFMGNISEIIHNKYDQLRASNVRVPWIIDTFYKFKQALNYHNQKFKIPVNFQQLIDLVDKLNNFELETLQKILINSEIKPNSMEKFQKYKDKIHFDEIYLEKLKDTRFQLINALNPNINEKNQEENLILETKNLCFTYPNSNINAIRDLSIKIDQGDFLGLIGPNGSGKTTLLYLLANLYDPAEGIIFYKDRNLRDLDSYEYAKKIGFIFQNPENMIFKSTLKEEILYGPKNFGIEKKITEDYLLKLINLIGNEDPDKNPYNLSWGQKRRLNLSSIFIYDPEIILLDEPFIGQDQRTIDSLIETLFIENKRGKTIIISSHDYHLLLKYTNRIIELNHDGTLREYDMKLDYFMKHNNLGPIILLNKIKEKLGAN